MRKLFIVICFSFLVVSCSHKTTVSKFDDEAFRTASSVPPIKVPAELQKTTYVEAYYPAPSGKYPEPGEPPVSPIPPNLGKLLKEEVPVQTPTKEK